jgi:hypothetical protein
MVSDLDREEAVGVVLLDRLVRTQRPTPAYTQHPTPAFPSKPITEALPGKSRESFSKKLSFWLMARVSGWQI